MKNNVFQPSHLYINYNAIKNIEHRSAKKSDGFVIEDLNDALTIYNYCDERLWSYHFWKAKTVPSQKAYKDSSSHPRVTVSNVPQELEALKQVLNTEPIILAFDVYESFDYLTTYMTGVVPMPKPREKITGAHAVLLCGYNDGKKMFTVQNSWGVFAGDSGYYYMPYDFVLNPDHAWGFLTLKLDN